MSFLSGRAGVRGLGMAAVAGLSLMVTGCNGFFVYPGSTGTTNQTTADYAYVANSATGSTYLNGYVVSSGTLVATTSSPYSLGYVPQAMAITPSDGYLYIASDSAISTGAIYGYSIGTGGALSILGGGLALISENVASIDISPDGQWLFALDSTSGQLNVYKIATTTGLLSFFTYANVTTQNSANTQVVPKSVRIAPSGEFVVCALGTGGAEIFPFNTSTGVLGAASGAINPNVAADGVNAIAIDANNYIYAVGTFGANNTPGLQVFSTTSAGVDTAVGSTYTVGNGPNSVVVSTSSNYVYVGNQTDSTISAFSTSSGTLTALNTGAAYNAPTDVGALGRDSSGGFLLASGYNATSGIQLYMIGSTGLLTASNSAGSGTTTAYPSPVALVH